MSLDELKERIKEEVVLREGDLFEWQWRQLGLVTEAETLGVPAGEFLGVVNEVSRAINPYFGRISDLKIKVTDLARLQRKTLTDAQISQIVTEATRLQLLPGFVKDRWLPAILATIPEPVDEPTVSTPAITPVTEPVNPQPIPARPPVQPAAVTPPPPVVVPAAGVDREAVTRRVHQFLNDYVADKLIPARVLKALFLATNFDESVLADAVLGYLSAHSYAAETPVQGKTVRDKLLSTDWRHLSWWESTPASVAAPAVASQPARPVPRSASDSSVIGLALVAVGLLIGAVWWITTGKSAQTPKIPPATVHAADSTPASAPLKKKSRRKQAAKP